MHDARFHGVPMKTLLLALACSAVALPACAPVQKIVAKAPGATATVLPTRDHEARGTVTFTRKGGAVVIAGRITGLSPGAHGFRCATGVSASGEGLPVRSVPACVPLPPDQGGALTSSA